MSKELPPGVDARVAMNSGVCRSIMVVHIDDYDSGTVQHCLPGPALPTHSAIACV